MWIRSQNKKTLVDAGSLFANNLKVFAYDKASVAYTLGEYETEERALEVLDEIQESIARDVLYRNESCIQAISRLTCNDTPLFLKEMQNGLIYQMPKE